MERVGKVVELSVGGLKFCTTEQTLTGGASDSDSNFFTALLSGKTPALRDSKGRYFIDRNGQYFQLILDYLRTGEWEVPREISAKVMREARFYGIEPAVFTPVSDTALRDAVETFRERQFDAQANAVAEDLVPFKQQLCKMFEYAAAHGREVSMLVARGVPAHKLALIRSISELKDAGFAMFQQCGGSMQDRELFSQLTDERTAELVRQQQQLLSELAVVCSDGFCNLLSTEQGRDLAIRDLARSYELSVAIDVRQVLCLTLEPRKYLVEGSKLLNSFPVNVPARVALLPKANGYVLSEVYKCVWTGGVGVGTGVGATAAAPPNGATGGRGGSPSIAGRP